MGWMVSLSQPLRPPSLVSALCNFSEKATRLRYQSLLVIPPPVCHFRPFFYHLNHRFSVFWAHLSLGDGGLLLLLPCPQSRHCLHEGTTNVDQNPPVRCTLSNESFGPLPYWARGTVCVNEAIFWFCFLCSEQWKQVLNIFKKSISDLFTIVFIIYFVLPDRRHA